MVWVRSHSNLHRYVAGDRRRLDFSPAIEADTNLAGVDNHRNAALAVGQFQHAFKAGIVFQDVDVFEWNLAPGEVRTGSRSVLSKILSEDDYFFVHGWFDALSQK
jgi:hypothetical protein